VPDDADARVSSEGWSARTDAGELNEARQAITYLAAVCLRDACPGLALQIVQNLRKIRVGVPGDDESRHRERSLSSLLASRWKNASPVMTAPRAMDARASST
jgi:hypothetical protein